MKLSNAVIRWAKTLKDYDPSSEIVISKTALQIHFLFTNIFEK